jgi:mannose-6-phosphate isomerase-like protein (cupin superfamily)
LIEEYFGRVHTAEERFSLAHMVAPPGWTEPRQTPEFGEITLMIRGHLRVEVDSAVHDLAAGQAIWVEPRTTVRYGNPFAEEAEYWAICLPAFSPDAVHRAET